MVIKIREKNQTNSPEEKAEGEKEAQGENRGRLILDATCAQGDISYPTDLGLLNKARQETEQIIDTLYESLKGKRRFSLGRVMTKLSETSQKDSESLQT